MTTATLVKKLNKQVEILQRDVRQLKEVLAVPPRDPEGEYRPSFIKKMLLREKTKGPFYRFIDKESFLKHVRSRK